MGAHVARRLAGAALAAVLVAGAGAAPAHAQAGDTISVLGPGPVDGTRYIGPLFGFRVAVPHPPNVKVLKVRWWVTGPDGRGFVNSGTEAEPREDTPVDVDVFGNALVNLGLPALFHVAHDVPYTLHARAVLEGGASGATADAGPFVGDVVAPAEPVVTAPVGEVADGPIRISGRASPLARDGGAVVGELDTLAGDPVGSFKALVGPDGTWATDRIEVDGSFVSLLPRAAYRLHVEQCDVAFNCGYHNSTFAVVAPPPASAPPPAPAPARVRPALSGARLAAKAFRRRDGTRLAFTLTAPARVTATLRRQTRGRRKGGRCVAGARRGRRCTVLAAAGERTFALPAGPASVAFGKGLRKGRYVVALSVADGDTVRASQTLRFRVR